MCTRKYANNKFSTHMLRAALELPKQKNKATLRIMHTLGLSSPAHTCTVRCGASRCGHIGNSDLKVQLWKTIAKQLSVIWEHPNLDDRVRIRCGRRILFSADSSFPPHRNAPHRLRCFRKLPFKIHYKKMSAMRRAASHRIGVSRP